MIQFLAPVLGTLVDRLIPDKNEAAKAKQEVEKSLIEAANQVNLEQIKTNQIEAAHRSVWVAGWRPALGWACSAGFAWIFIGHPILVSIFAANGMDINALPDIDSAPLIEMTFAMLGLAGLRTYEKGKGLTR